jgi:hypothetical protein
MDCLLQNKHLVGCSDIMSLNLVEKHPMRLPFDIKQYIMSFFWIDGSSKQVEGIVNPCSEVKITLEYQSYINYTLIRVLIKWLTQITIKFNHPIHKLVRAGYLIQYILQIEPNTSVDRLQLVGMCVAYYAGLFTHWNMELYGDTLIQYMKRICHATYSEYCIKLYINQMKYVSNQTFEIHFEHVLDDTISYKDNVERLSKALIDVIV